MYKDPSAPLPNATFVSYEDILAIRYMEVAATSNSLYRLVWFDDPNKRVNIKDGENMKTDAEFTIAEGRKVAFDLIWYPSHQHEPVPVNIDEAIQNTGKWWRGWPDRCAYQGEWREAVLRSLITLKALTFLPMGGIVAAQTTSLPELLGLMAGDVSWSVVWHDSRL